MSLARIGGLLALCWLAVTTPVRAHDAEPQAWHEVWTIWNDDWWLWVVVLAFGAWYARGVHVLWRQAGAGAGISRTRALAFALGWLASVAALLSPIDPLGGQLFSAHMVQHEILMLIAAPLLVVGRPIGAFLWGLPQRWRRSAWQACHRSGLQGFVRWLTTPTTAWLVHAIALWGWHVPVLFDASIRSDLVHTAQHVSFFGTALAFWWALMRPGAGRETRGLATIYIVTTAMHTAALGALLTFAPRVWYSVYLETTPTWGIDALEDQRLGGLIMWVPAGFVYLAIALALFAAWLRDLSGRQSDVGWQPHQ